MPISMELPVFPTLRVPPFSRLALVPAFNIPFSSLGATGRLKCNARKAHRICVMCLVRDSIPMETKCESDGDWSEFIEVVVIGSRKESIMDSCLDSPFRSLPLRFWSISRDSSGDLLLLQRLNQEDHVSTIMNPAELIQSRPRAFILVASGGYGSDQVEAINILSAVRSEGSLAVAVLLKPFSFEGRKRLEEVNELARKLQQHTSFCIGTSFSSMNDFPTQ